MITSFFDCHRGVAEFNLGIFKGSSEPFMKEVKKSKDKDSKKTKVKAKEKEKPQDAGEANLEYVRGLYRKLLEAVYRRYNKEKLVDLPAIIEKYVGQEAEMYDKVCRKYVFCQPEKEWRPLIIEMYKCFNPSKLNELDRVLDKYRNSEPALYRALCDKYLQSTTKDGPNLKVDVWEDSQFAGEDAPEDAEDSESKATGLGNGHAQSNTKVAETTKPEVKRAAPEAPPPEEEPSRKKKETTQSFQCHRSGWRCRRASPKEQSS